MLAVEEEVVVNVPTFSHDADQGKPGVHQNHWLAAL
jgi:hypothetical protein